MAKETLKSLEDIELVIPAKQVYDALVQSIGGTKIVQFDEARAKEMKTLLGFQNSLIKAFQEKKGYFKLVLNIDAKVKAIKKLSKKSR